MWISMCKKSEYLVKNNRFIHNQSTLDENKNVTNVNKVYFISTLYKLFHNFIHALICFNKSILKGFTRFPQQLLLLLLSIKLNIINKTTNERSFK